MRELKEIYNDIEKLDKAKRSFVQTFGLAFKQDVELTTAVAECSFTYLSARCVELEDEVFDHDDNDLNREKIERRVWREGPGS